MKEIYGYVGEMGAGKTHFALQKIKELKSDGKTVLMISWADPIKSILNNYGLLKSGPIDNHLFEEFKVTKPESFIAYLKDSILEIIEKLGIQLYDYDYQRFGSALMRHTDDLNKICINIINGTDYFENYRKLMQIVGTDLGRCLYDSIWIDETLGIIKQAFYLDIAHAAIIDDIRFQNEFDSFQDFGEKNHYKCIIYGIRSDLKTRSDRTWIDTTDLKKFQEHGSEKYIPNLLDKIPSNHIIHN